jgi:predicted enzyme related to lactoylglutathione lyase
MQVVDIAFTGYSVSDMKRARAFYEGLLGLKRTRGFGQLDGEERWVEYDLGSACLALIAGGGEDWPPGSTGVASALEVDDFPAFVARLREAGVKFVFEPYESPVCWMVVANDPDGNRVVLHQRKPAPPGGAKA